MKILVWSQYFWPENFVINKVVTALSQLGSEVTVLTGKPNYPEGRIFDHYKASQIQYESYSGADVIRLPMVPRRNGTGLDLLINYCSFIVSAFVLAPLVLKGKKFDIIFVYAPSPLLQAIPAIVVSKIKRIPTCIWVQDLWPESLAATGHIKQKHLLAVVRYIVRKMYNRINSILIPSEGFRRAIGNLISDQTKIRYFPNVAEASKRSLTHGKIHAGKLANGIFSVVFAGNVGRAQSVETIINAAVQLSHFDNIQFVIVGVGSCKDWMQREVKRRRLANVNFVGRVSEAEAAQILSEAGALLVSLKDDPVLSLTVPSKLQSYLSAGRPIIASMNGEGAKIVELSGAGISCPAEDGGALAEAVRRISLLSDRDRHLMGQNGIKYFTENFELLSQVSKLKEYLEEVISSYSEKEKRK